MLENIWIVPLLPLLGFLVIGLNFKRFKGITAGVLASALMVFAFIASVLAFVLVKDSVQPLVVELFSWINVDILHVSFAFQIDRLSALMLLIVTGVGSLIHIYSIGYMKEDEGFNRFFSYLNLFVFFMLMLVLGSNYLIMFIGWEGVGLSSYLLIGFWFKNHEYNNAAKKAFIMNRIGDLGFLLGIFLLFKEFHTLDFITIQALAHTYSIGNPTITCATLLLFVGAMGKSAQLPLFTWLPDAMAGPTPVSALIHAATMVTAGIYMIVRSNLLFTLSPLTLSFITAIGIATALVSGVIAIFQNDIKKVLAYSTVSQLGMMFMALGLGAFSGAMFHLTTHAFFKALLFLGAGSVIHALHGEQDIRKMGGLKSKIKFTYYLFLIGTIAIVGLPPFSGFFSKDAILMAAFEKGAIAWILGALIAALTTIYMFRLLFLTFFGSARYDLAAVHPHESPKSMTYPMAVLAILAIIGGLLGVPSLMGGSNWIQNYLEPITISSTALLASNASETSHLTEWITMLIPMVVSVVILILAYKKYAVSYSVKEEPEARSIFRGIASNKFYIDEVYNALVIRPIEKLSSFFYNVIDIKLIDNFVNSIGDMVEWASKTVRQVQTGNVGFYLFMMVAFTIFILLYNILN